MRWDIYCRVIDNYGDIGVCWRLAAELGRRGEQVCLWVDDSRALRWMAPLGASGVEVRPWTPDAMFDPAADVVIEAFGCEIPEAVVRGMARRRPAPLWINLEYLSAEPYVERSHGLPSPVLAGPGSGLTKWFYFPGFTRRTGGLLGARDIGAGHGPHAVDAAALGSADQAASVFCYANTMLPHLERSWPGPLLLLPGPAQGLTGENAWHLPWLTQPDYDRLLGRCALNFVRGEDSFVRAMWAARPFVWQIYPQQDGAQRVKLEAFLDQFLAGSQAGLATDLRALWRAWNGFGEWPARWPDWMAWTECCERWRAGLEQQDDLVTQLIRFVAERQ